MTGECVDMTTVSLCCLAHSRTMPRKQRIAYGCSAVSGSSIATSPPSSEHATAHNSTIIARTPLASFAIGVRRVELCNQRSPSLLKVYVDDLVRKCFAQSLQHEFVAVTLGPRLVPTS